MLLLQLVAALAGAGFLASATSAQSAPLNSVAPAAVSPATASELARAVAPADVAMPLEIEQARKAILSLPTVDEEAKQLEKEFPGLYAAVWAAVETEMRRSVEADYPAFWASLEQLYVARLTEREAQAALAFFRSATGQKLMRSMYGSFDAAPLFAEMINSGSSMIEARQMQSVTDAAKVKAVQQIGPEDEASLRTLMASIDLEKFRALGAETQKLSLEWVNKEDPESEERLGKIMQDAMEQYMAAHPLKK